jgi:DNA polymerase-1
MEKSKLLLVDANSLIHRAYHALPPLDTKGIPSNALFGVASILLKVIKEESPSYIAGAFDRPEETFRKAMFKEYKITRPKAPEELVSQIIEAHNLFEAFKIKTFEMPGFEADDIIGTLAKNLKNDDLKIIILTGDLDTLQLVEDEKIVVKTLKKGVSETIVYNEDAIKERYGLPPKLLIDYKALVGDKSDNIPGVKNIGPKTAVSLLKRYGSLEKILEAKDEKNKALKRIQEEREIALLSKELATIQTNVPLKVSLEELKFNFEEKSLKDYFFKWEFKSLINRLENLKENYNAVYENKKEDFKTINAFFIEKFTDLDVNKTLSKNLKVSWNWKPIIKDLIKNKKEIPQNIFDLGIAFWLLNPETKKITKENITQKILHKKFEENDWKNAFVLLKTHLEKNNLEKIFYEIEMPLIEVLSFMEINGIKVNRKTLLEIIQKIELTLEEKSNEIFQMVGEKFNLNSPRQVSEIIFKKLKIKNVKKSKTQSGLFSTSKDVLSQNKEEKIIKLLLEYRELFKLWSTYLKPLPLLLDENSKAHTNYIQNGTATGRIASSSPNLQNLPQESIFSKDIRNIFEAENGFSFISFDYSQLELRLLAYVVQDENLKLAFLKGHDIHTLTASKVLGIKEEEISKEQRRLGKTLNFGIIYGMGEKAFAQNAGISYEEARFFIKEYFKNFPKIKEWQEKTKKEVIEKGFVENINGRKRWFWGWENPKIKAQNERAAINMPIQSLGADILKKSMIKIQEMIKKEGIQNKAKMVLTIHDELIFEVDDDILKEIIPKIKNIMENIDERLSSLLKVEVNYGNKLGELKKYENK